MGEAGCYQEAKFEGVTNVEALDDLTVKISFADPMPNPYGPSWITNANLTASPI